MHAFTRSRTVIIRQLGMLLIVLCSCICSLAQTVEIDATPSHVANTFSPIQALGATLDRIPSNTTDVFFRPDQVKQILEAGWGPISYRPVSYTHLTLPT